MGLVTAEDNIDSLGLILAWVLVWKEKDAEGLRMVIPDWPPWVELIVVTLQRYPKRDTTLSWARLCVSLVIVRQVVGVVRVPARLASLHWRIIPRLAKKGQSVRGPNGARGGFYVSRARRFLQSLWPSAFENQVCVFRPQ